MILPFQTFTACSKPIRMLMTLAYAMLAYWSLFLIANEYTLIPSALAYTKDLTLLLIVLFSLLLKEGMKPWTREPSLLFFYAILLVYMPASVYMLGMGYETTIGVFKYFQPLLALLAASNMYKLTTRTLDDWVRWFYVGCFFLIGLNFIGYFAPSLLKMSYNHADYPNRIVVGQPTPVAYVLSLGLLYALFIPAFGKKQVVLVLTLLFGVLIIVPGTTLAALAVVLVLVFFLRKWLPQGNALRLKLFLALLLLLSVAISILLTSDRMEVRLFLMLLELKMKAAIGLVEDPSLNARSERYAYVLNHLNPYHWFGTGLNSYAYYTKQIITQSTNLEHGFRAMLMNFGVLGLIVYLLYFVKQFYQLFRHGRNNPYGLLHLSVLINYLLHHFTLDVPYFYPMVIPTFFFFVYCRGKYMPSA